MNFIGVMQGRLSPRPYPKLQAFPWATWEDEFHKAKDYGYDAIEWLFEADDYKNNPIWISDGRNRIQELINENEVYVNTLCADYFMEHPFYRVQDKEREESIEVLKELIEKAAEIGVQTILIPVLESSELRSQNEYEELKYSLKACAQIAGNKCVKLGIETELPAKEYLKLIEYIGDANIGAYYDTGNSAARGYNMRQDMEILKNVLVGVHIKDRKVGSVSVPIGTGDANFKEGIPYLIESGYLGGFVLQYFYDNNPISTAVSSLAYIKNKLSHEL